MKTETKEMIGGALVIVAFFVLGAAVGREWFPVYEKVNDYTVEFFPTVNKDVGMKFTSGAKFHEVCANFYTEDLMPMLSCNCNIKKTTKAKK